MSCGGYKRGNLIQNEICSPNPDKTYNRKEVLTQLADTLDSLIPEFRGYEKNGFSVDNEKPSKFFVYDLFDTLNNTLDRKRCINMIEGHVYHFSAILYQFSFSNILILNNGKMKIFKAVNCVDKGDNIEDVIAYIKTYKITQDEAYLNRIKGYRKFGSYLRIDNYVNLRCQSIQK